MMIAALGVRVRAVLVHGPDGRDRRRTATTAPRTPARRGPVRLLWLLAGLLATALGGVGIVLPGLPSTVFFIVAASCFTRSSPRMEAWVLGLPGVGALVRDYRAGLGMPRRAKVVAIGSIAVVGGLSVGFAVASLPARAAILGACAVGIAVIAWRVPTRERVQDAR